MKDRVPGAPGQYQAVLSAEDLAKLQNNEPFTITLTRDDRPIEEGTPYNKASVLPDELAATICPDIEDPTPADALLATYRAPARYGLGTIGKYVEINSLSDLDRILKNGWYSIYSETAMTLGGVDFHVLTLEVSILNESYGTQTIKHLSDTGELRRKMIGGAWGEWEWDAPPMKFGAEYRTTERLNGKAVYVKAISFGAMPNSSYASVSSGIDAKNIIDIKANVYHAGDNVSFMLPIVTNSYTVGTRVWCENTSLMISASGDMSAWTATVVLKYTKD